MAPTRQCTFAVENESLMLVNGGLRKKKEQLEAKQKEALKIQGELTAQLEKAKEKAAEAEESKRDLANKLQFVVDQNRVLTAKLSELERGRDNHVNELRTALDVLKVKYVAAVNAQARLKKEQEKKLTWVWDKVRAISQKNLAASHAGPADDRNAPPVDEDMIANVAPVAEAVAVSKCPLCLEDIARMSGVVALNPCGHVLCEGCWEGFGPSKQPCFMCRKDFTSGVKVFFN